MSRTSYRSCTLVPKIALIEDKVWKKPAISIDSDGYIIDVVEYVEGTTYSGEIVFLPDEFLMAGFVNAHSHAFHRHLRGRSEIGGNSAETFWKWRDNMYSLVDGVTKTKLYEYCHSTFSEMLTAGITTVGEFHYVHHSSEGQFDLDSTVIQAAKDVGIRITLIQTLYERAGFDNGPIHPVQKSFISQFDEFLESVENLLTNHQSDTVTIAVAAHSTRGVPFDDIKKLYDYSKRKGIAFHIHLEEQPKEIQDCLLLSGQNKTPSDILIETLDIEDNFTSVHSTYTSPANMIKFANLQANVCICALTEGYLGDGIPFVPPNLPISFGTDCNNRISFLEEMRWACFTQQMKNNSRSVAGLSAKRLVEAATMGGAKSLCLEKEVGELKIGKKFDAVSFSLSSGNLSNCHEAEEVLDSIVFGCGNREIKQVIVDGYIRYTIN